MRSSGGSVGPRGITLLVVTAVAGIALGAHGWLGRQSGVTSGALGGSGSSSSLGSPPSPAAASPSAAGPNGSSPGRRSASRVGPALRSQSYASYAFQVWPGRPSPAAKSAMTGLSITVGRTASGLSVRAGVTSQQQAPARSYVGGARVYVVEASMGDEAGGSDYNLGDDGLVVTDAHGRIVR